MDRKGFVIVIHCDGIFGLGQKLLVDNNNLIIGILNQRVMLLHNQFNILLLKFVSMEVSEPFLWSNYNYP